MHEVIPFPTRTPMLGYPMADGYTAEKFAEGWEVRDRARNLIFTSQNDLTPFITATKRDSADLVMAEEQMLLVMRALHLMLGAYESRGLQTRLGHVEEAALGACVEVMEGQGKERAELLLQRLRAEMPRG